jgi:O-succinylbenzoic acid--CoA ligase
MQDWLRAAARARPDHEALELDGRSLTYAELDERATARAGTLPGGSLAVDAPPGLAFVELLHAAPRAGAAFEPWPPGAAGPLPAGEPGELRFEHDPDEVHTIIHTSGTTGAPKAVELTFGNHAAAAVASADAVGVDPDDRWLCPLPLHHVGGLNVLIRSVINRTTVVLHERFEVERVKAELESGAVTLASMVPTMLARLQAAGLGPTPGVRAIALGGGPIPAGLLDWAAEAGVPAVPVYGMTETCSQIVAGSPGRPLRGVELEIAPDGEVLVRGPMVAPGELDADGWLHTGDLGKLDEDGRLQVLGRVKELIVTGGENVAPLEVEQALLAHPAVVDAGVAGLPDPDWGEAVTAYVVVREPPGDLREWCRARLEAFKVPKAVHVVDELPRNSGGKLMRERLGA